VSHTPAPWSNRENEYRQQNYGTASFIGPDGRGIGAISSSIRRPAEENRANSLLIQYAPELLDALEMMILVNSHEPLTGAQLAAMTRARAVTRKARGGR
jgi:hypothetical protein